MAESYGFHNSFDHHSAEFARDPAGEWKKLRKQCPVSHSDKYGGFWIFTRYGDVVPANRDSERFSTADDPFGTGQGGSGVTIPPSPVRFGFFELDEPEHLQQRRIYDPWFSLSAIEKHKPAWRKITTQVVDKVIEKGQADLVLDVIEPIAGMILCEFLGLRIDQWKRYMDPFRDAVIVDRSSPEFDRVETELHSVMDDLKGHMDARRMEPKDDLITYAIHAQVDGKALPESDTLMNLFAIVSGGIETTVGLLSNTLMHLHQDHELRERLIAEAELIPSALEEFNRYYTPVQALARTVKTDCPFAGQELKKGERILLAYGSANRDESMFEQPDEVILDRFPNRHVSFGMGPHRCLGSSFARVETAIVLEEVLRRMSDYQVLEDQAQKFPTCAIANSYITLPAVFTPGPTSDKA